MDNCGGDSAKIEYRLRAKLKGSGIIQNYQATHVVKVQAKNEFSPAEPYVITPQTVKIKAFGLITRGEMSFGAKVESTTLVPGQAPMVQIALDNSSMARIEAVKVELQEVVTWYAGGEKRTVCNRLCTGRFDEYHFAGSQKLDKESLQQKKIDGNNRQRSYHQIDTALNGCSKGLSKCSIPCVPDYTLETFQGISIHVSHALRVKLKTKFGSTNPEFSIPVQIAHPVQPSTSSPNHSLLYPAFVPMATAEPIYDDCSTIGDHKPSMKPDV